MELLVVLAIIGLLSSIILASFTGIREKARDTKRKAEISQFGKFLTMFCYLPDGGGGEYDLMPLAAELIIKYPQYGKFFSSIPRDPKAGTDTESKYIYIVNTGGTKCALYANLENVEEPITLSITSPTPGGGSGVLKADSPGWNGTPLYFQSSN